MQVVWEADTPDFHKRKRAARACLSCQKRKKKCRHTFQDAAGDGVGEDESHDSMVGDISGDFAPPRQAEIIRFVGDTNPESILTDISNRSKGATRPHRLGTWIEPSAGEDQEHLPTAVPAEASNPTLGGLAAPIGKKDQRRMNIHQERYLRDIGAFRVLPQQTQDVLITLYFSCIDPVLPLFDDGTFLQKFRQGSASNLLINAVCLVSCKTEDATNYLRLSPDGPVLPPFTFARALYAGLEAAMKADLEPDRITKVQILALLSLHNDGPNGIEDSSIHLTQAIHHAHTAAIQVHYSGERPEGHPRMLYWCLWSLDKINASLAGRPVTIADRDIGITRPILENEPIFQGFIMWLTISDLLAQVIAYYRPMASQDATGWEEDFPTFHQVIDAHSFHTLQQSHQGRAIRHVAMIFALIESSIRYSRNLLQYRRNTNMQSWRCHNPIVPAAGEGSGTHPRDCHSSWHRPTHPTTSSCAICSVAVVDCSLSASAGQ